MARSLAEVRSLWDRVKSRYAMRDQAMENVFQVRQGNLNMVFPDLFPQGPLDKGIVANMVDVAARDLSEVIAPLPAFNCSSTTMVTDKAKKFAEKRGRIVNDLILHSKLQKQMFTAADRYVTYGFVPLMVEVDADAKKARLQFHDSKGCYPTFNRWGEVESVFFSGIWTRDEVVARWPEATSVLNTPAGGSDIVEVVRYHDRDVDYLFLPAAQGGPFELESAANKLRKVLCRIVKRPGLETDNARGQFDDVLALQVAKHRLALLSLDAATKAVQAPIALPQDVTELAVGPDATLKSSQPEKIRRVPLDIPPAAFAMSQEIDQDLRLGSRYPDARTGNVDGSIVTGRGVQALMSGFDTQIRTAQAMFADAFTEAMGLALEVQEKLFPKRTYDVRGNENGTPYSITYVPEKDIAGDYTVDVQYGLMAGLDPNRALVFGLQARGDELISRDFMRRNMPFALNATEEEQKIDMEKLREAGFQGIAAYVQSIPAMAQNGMDPTEAIQKLVTVIDGRAKGKSLEECLSAAFAPPPPPPGVESAGAEAAPLPGSPGEAPPGGGGGDVSGLAPGVAPGQQGMAPGGRPDVMNILAGITGSGAPNLTAAVSRRRGVNG